LTAATTSKEQSGWRDLRRAHSRRPNSWSR